MLIDITLIPSFLGTWFRKCTRVFCIRFALETATKFHWQIKLRFVGFDVLTAVVMKSSILWNITPPCLSPAFTLVSCLAYSSTLKMEVTCSSETSVDFQLTTRRYIPEFRTLQDKICSEKVNLGQKTFK
jgi:hypothetical protein